jgi:HK97 family phage portal protein
MSLLWSRRDLGDTSTQLTPPRTRSFGSVTVSEDSALRHSAVWACLRLRADLISTMPIKTFRQVGDLQVQVPASPFITNPANDEHGLPDWLYASQVELDRCGNSFGIIRARDALGLPAVVELVPHSRVQIRGKGPVIEEFSIGGAEYQPRDVWHERQFSISGVPLGLSPVAYSAMSVGTYLSAAQFAVDWFANGSIPGARLRNTAKTIDPKEALIAKERFKAAVANRDIFVHGADWEFNMISVTANESQFLDTMRYGIADVCRFFGVPADMIDAEVKTTAKITYANISQRNLQLLNLNLQPALVRRERKLSSATPKPRFVKFDSNSLLRMDPQALAAMLAGKVAGRLMTPTEARAVDGRPPYTETDLAEFDRLFGAASGAAPAVVGQSSAETAGEGEPST